MNTRNSIPGARTKRDRVDDISNPDSPEYNPSDPDFDDEWSEKDSIRAKRNDSTGTGGISGIPLTGQLGIVRAGDHTNSLLRGKK